MSFWQIFIIRALQIMIDPPPPLYSEAKFLEGGGGSMSWNFTNFRLKKFGGGECSVSFSCSCRSGIVNVITGKKHS